jgi:hypothetical protein
MISHTADPLGWLHAQTWRLMLLLLQSTRTTAIVYFQSVEAFRSGIIRCRHVVSLIRVVRIFGRHNYGQ